jgi:hypothetical protein
MRRNAAVLLERERMVCGLNLNKESLSSLSSVNEHLQIQSVGVRGKNTCELRKKKKKR